MSGGVEGEGSGDEKVTAESIFEQVLVSIISVCCENLGRKASPDSQSGQGQASSV